MKVSDKRETIKSALRARLRMADSDEECFCIFDGVQRAGLDVRFLPLDSLEGMYCQSVPPTAIISSRRPEGRQRFTCAHEFAHHELRHEASLDPVEATVISSNRDPNEGAANLYAAMLLMPPSLIQMLFRKQLCEPQQASSLDVFAIASAVGVGYSTLLTHMHITLRILSTDQHNYLQRESPRSIRESLALPDEVERLIVFSDCWAGRPLDVPVNGHVFSTGKRAEALAEVGGFDCGVKLTRGILFRATTVGTYHGSSAASVPAVRVYDPTFQGRAAFRFIGKDGSDENL